MHGRRERGREAEGGKDERDGVFSWDSRGDGDLMRGGLKKRVRSFLCIEKKLQMTFAGLTSLGRRERRPLGVYCEIVFVTWLDRDVLIVSKEAREPIGRRTRSFSYR